MTEFYNKSKGSLIEDNYLLISGIQHFVFCRRQWALIHIEQLWEENFFTIDGQIKHKKVNNTSTLEVRDNVRVLRSLPVISHELEMQCKCDVVELQPNDNGYYFSKYNRKYKVFPIEYKRGKPKADLSDTMQLLAQAMCLEEMLGLTIDEGACFYFETRRRKNITFTNELRIKLKNMVNEMNNYYKRRYTPRVRKSNKCKVCSLKDICLPELDGTMTVSNYIEKRLKEK